MKNLLVISVLLILISCKKEEQPRSWQFSESITIEDINPIGITANEEGIWLSDGDHNRLVLIDEKGVITKKIDSFERPMHIASGGKYLYIPEYGNDKVIMFMEENYMEVPLSDSLDAPAGVAVLNSEMAIADFYNHRILYSQSGNGKDWISIGKEGKAEGELYYPTDVHITENKIWIADAYNNRISVFDKAGNFLKVIGSEEKMNAATGIFVSTDEVFITDFENDRLLIFDHEGILKQELKQGIEKPTDILLLKNRLYSINYRSGNLTIFDWKEDVLSAEEE